MATSAQRGRFQIYRSELKGYTWSLLDSDEQVVAHVPTYYASPADCLDAIERVKGGKRLGEGRRSLEEIRTYAQQAFEQLPPAIQDIDPAGAPYPVALSDRLQAEYDRIREELKARVATAPSFAFTRSTGSTNNH